MLADILHMQDADGKTPSQIKKEHVRRTTIILEEEEREYIDRLVRDGKEAGIKQLISKMLDVYRSMSVYDWKYPGEYYSGISRIAFVKIEFINTLLQHIPSEQHYQVGRKAGEAARIGVEASLNIKATDKERWPEVFKRLRIHGFGDFYQKDRYIIVKSPFISNEQLHRGFLETLLGASLETRTTSPPFVYEIIP
ncbi:MAG: hypothetical protein NWE78_01270 [Candidatus Bathyarchaeota archaeon]|nr:hypothetical protein [Candidatus Bathyarchaeota archaeon]